jgi:hypothetical protein
VQALERALHHQQARLRGKEIRTQQEEDQIGLVEVAHTFLFGRLPGTQMPFRPA